MAFPDGWVVAVGKGLRPASGIRSGRVYIEATSTQAWVDRAYSFYEIAGANTIRPTPVTRPGAEKTTVAFGDSEASGVPMGGGPAQAYPGGSAPVPMLWCRMMQISNDGDPTVPDKDLLVTFDGVTLQGRIKPGETRMYVERFEAGIALKGDGAAVDFRVEAW